MFEKDIHDLDYRADNVEKYWRKKKLEKNKLAKKYFNNRRNGIPLTWDNKNYSLNQTLGNVPKKVLKQELFFILQVKMSMNQQNINYLICYGPIKNML